MGEWQVDVDEDSGVMLRWTHDQALCPWDMVQWLGNGYVPANERERAEDEATADEAFAALVRAVRTDPVGAVEIATRVGVERPTVDQWRQRDLGFPQPRWTVGGRPAWDWQDVAAWLAATGRA